MFEPAIDKNRLDQAGKTESNRSICLRPFSYTNEIHVRILSVCVSQCLQTNKTRSYLIITLLQTTPYLIQTHSMLEMCRNLFLLISTSAKSWNKFNSFICFGFDFHEPYLRAVEVRCQWKLNLINGSSKSVHEFFRVSCMQMWTTNTDLRQITTSSLLYHIVL